jgi:hypothetical protein
MVFSSKRRVLWTDPSNPRPDYLDRDDFVELMEGFKGHTISYMRLETIPKFNVKSRVTKRLMQEELGINPANVRKLSFWSVRIGYDYEKSVTNQLKREEKSEELYKRGDVWHKPYVTRSGMTSKTIAIHPETGELYFKVLLNKWKTGECSPENRRKKESRIRSEFLDMSTGRTVPKILLKDFLPPYSAPKNQGVEKGNEIEMRTLKLASVKRLAFGGKIYILE